MHLKELDIDSIDEDVDQDEIFDGYVKILGKENAQKLHQFFSPTRIPRGLTRTQAMICVKILPLRNKHTERKLKKKPGLTSILDPRGLESDEFLKYDLNPNFSLNALIGTLALPRELECDGSQIPKLRFYKGIFKLLYRAIWKD